MKNKKLWLFGCLAAALTATGFLKTQAYYQQRERLLEISNTRLHERLFIEILRSEIKQIFPNTAHSVSSSGGVNESGRNFELTTVNDVTFDSNPPVEQLKSLAATLSGNPEIASWRSLAAQKNITRICHFQVVEKTGKPYLRMLMLESSRTSGIPEAEMLRALAGDYQPDQQASIK